MASNISAKVLSIQSHVVHGYVGNKSATFPLQVLGFEVDAINTVQFSTHTGYKHIKGTVLNNDDLAGLIEGLQLNGVDHYTHLLTGYNRNAESLLQVAAIVKKMREKNPNMVYVCDPVMGDHGKMYVPPDVLPAYRDSIIPLADILTPNQFEAQELTGLPLKNIDDAVKVIRALHDKGVQTVVLSSTDLGDDNHMIAIASASQGDCYKISIPKFNANFTGTGDLFAALFLAWYFKTNQDVKSTLEKTIATLQVVVKDTFQVASGKAIDTKLSCADLELRLIQNKEAIENPRIEIEAAKLS